LLGHGTGPDEGLSISSEGQMLPSTEGKVGQGCYGFECQVAGSDGKVDVRKTVQDAWTRSIGGKYNRGLSMPECSFWFN